MQWTSANSREQGLAILSRIKAFFSKSSQDNEAAATELREFIISAKSATQSYEEVLAAGAGEVSEDVFRSAWEQSYRAGQIVAKGEVRLPIGTAYIPAHFLINIAYLELKHLDGTGDSLAHLRGAVSSLEKLERKAPFPHPGLSALVETFEGTYNSYLSVLGAIVAHPQNHELRTKDAQLLADGVIKNARSYPVIELISAAVTAITFLLEPTSSYRGIYLPYKVVVGVLPRLEEEWSEHLVTGQPAAPEQAETFLNFVDLSLLVLCNHHEVRRAEEVFKVLKPQRSRKQISDDSGEGLLKLLKSQRPELFDAFPSHFFE